MKKIKYLVILFIFLLNINNVSAFDTSKKVYDYAQILTIKEESKLKNEIDSLMNNYNIDLVLITVKHHGKDNTNNYIKEFYNTNGFGIGQNKDAVFCVIDFSSAQEAIEISVFGNTQSILSDNNIKNIKNKLNTKLSKQEYYKTLDLFLNIYNKTIQKNINNTNNIIDYNVIKIIKILFLSVIITLIIGGVLLLKNRDIKYKSVIKEYVDANSFTINKMEEKLVTTKTITNKQEVKMNKKGFTLIELLAVIIVLSVIILITAVSVNKTLDNTDNQLSKTQIKNIESAGKMYYLEEGMNLSDSYGCVNVNDLIKKGYIEKDEVTDPKTNEKVLGSVIVTYKNKKYKYTYQDKTCLTYQNGTPVYFDVARGVGCTEEEYKKSFDETKNDYLNSSTGYNGITITNEKQNSCLKFYAFNDNNDTVDLILDHNTTVDVTWNSSKSTIDGPKEIIEKLKEDTKDWNGTIEPFSYTVDHRGNVNGAYYTIDYEGMNARLITAEDLAKIGNTTWSGDSLSISNNLWLYDRVSNSCTDAGCANNSNDENIKGYYTASAISSNNSVLTLLINTSSISLQITPTGSETTTLGIRPVITVSKLRLVDDEEKVNTIKDICTLASDSTVTGLNAGAKYECKVDPNKEPYTFYVLTTPAKNDTYVNLIMDQNINSDGTPAGMNGVTQYTNPNCYNLVVWNNETDKVGNKYGPLTSMKFLYQATKNWTNVPPLNYTYEDRKYQEIPDNDTTAGYTSFISNSGIAVITPLLGEITTIGTIEEPLRARMPIYSGVWNNADDSKTSEKGEVADKTEANAYLYENIDLSGKPPYGYKTLSSYAGENTHAWSVFFDGYVSEGSVNYADYDSGVRPVISLKI